MVLVLSLLLSEVLPIRAQETPATEVGYLHLLHNAGEAYVLIGDEFGAIERAPASPNNTGDQPEHDTIFQSWLLVPPDTVLALLPGRYEIKLAGKQRFDHLVKVTIKSGETTRELVVMKIAFGEDYMAHSAYPAVHEQANLAVITDAESAIYIDGVYQGQGVVKQAVEPGIYELRVEHPTAGVARGVVSISSAPLRLKVVELYSKPEQSTAFVLSVLPGLAQVYKDQPRRAALALGLTAAGAGLAYTQHRTYQQEAELYADMQTRYRQASEEQLALQLGDEAEVQFEKTRQAAQRRDIAFGIAAGIYALTLIDSWLPPRYGYREAPKDVLDLVVRWKADRSGAGLYFALRF